MGKKATKATKKFASSGQLKKVIQARHRHRQVLKKSQGRRGAKDGKERAEPKNVEDDLEEDEVQKPVQRFACNIGRGSLLTFSEAKKP
jgi:nucleolar complex protein 2